MSGWLAASRAAERHAPAEAAMPSSARWLLALSGILISASALVFWSWLGGAGQAPEAQPGWFTLTALRFFWLPFLSGAGLVLAVCCAGRSGR
ncbi:hypothetical protein [Leisingera thetidis]|uniref:hypothetical protein n=1 Tax=Leisingera thetidis TaxID=2930199 RepID=UPI0021F7D8D9|nr:hypothetical protein [Leisingera thetidis]